MRTRLFPRPGRSRGRRHGRPRARLTGCLLWIFVLFLLLIILSLLFGGFHKGTKADGAGATAWPPGASAVRLPA